jgi:type I restriction-modification system DNA methylase subunit
MSNKFNNDENENEDQFITRDDLRDYIHSIHNFIRNNGAGYGQTGVKIFSVFYGLKLIQPLLDTFGFSKEQKEKLDFNILVEKAKKAKKDKNNNSGLTGYIDNEILDILYNLKIDSDDPNHKLGHFICYAIPRDLKDNVWVDLILKINKVPVGYKKERKVNLSGKVWEYFVGRDSTAISELGAYFSDRHITEFTFNKIKPKLINGMVPTMIDPFGGSGGFTLGYANYMRELSDDIDWETNVNNIYHFDMEESVVNMTGLEIFAITGYFPDREYKNNFSRVNSFTHEFAKHNKPGKFNYIFTNPPYGGDKVNKNAEQLKRDILIEYIKKIPTEERTDNLNDQLLRLTEISNDYKKKQEENHVRLNNCSSRIRQFAKKYNIDTANDKESCSLILMMDMLAENGTCCGILKEGIFFDGKYSKLRQVLVDNFNVTDVISVPQNAFENTSTKTSIIIFHNNGKTNNINFSELQVITEPDNVINIAEDGEAHIINYKDEIIEVIEKQLTCASYSQIIEPTIIMSKGIEKKRYDYSLNGKDYNKKEIVVGDGYTLNNLNDICNIELGTRITKNNNTEGEIPVYGGGDITFYTNKSNRSENTLIISRYALSKTCVRLLPYEFYLNDSGLSIKTKNKDLQTYINYYLLSDKNQEYIYYECTSGSIQRNLNMNIFNNLQLPVPKSEQKIKEWVDKISKPYDKKNGNEKLIKKLEEQVRDKIMDIGENEDCDEVELGSLCDINNKKIIRYDTSYGKETGIYKFHTGATDGKYFIDKYNIDKYTIILNKTNGSGKCNIFLDKNISCAKQTYICQSINNELETQYIYYYLFDKKDKLEVGYIGACHKNLSSDFLNKFKIKIPKDKQLIKDLEPLFQEIEKLQTEMKKAETQYKELIKELSEEANPSNKQLENELLEDIIKPVKESKKKSKKVDELNETPIKETKKVLKKKIKTKSNNIEI